MSTWGKRGVAANLWEECLLRTRATDRPRHCPITLLGAGTPAAPMVSGVPYVPSGTTMNVLLSVPEAS